MTQEPLALNGSRDQRKLSTWFLGPKAENEQEFLELIIAALHGHSAWRRTFVPLDPPYIDVDLKNSIQYKTQILKLKAEISKLNERMRNSLPATPRQKGYTNWDVSKIGLLGYFAALLFNQNKGTTEGSAVINTLEQDVAEDLCKMLQFRSHVDPKDIGAPIAWGHITVCGSEANIEAAWVARNVKYLAYTIRLVIDTEMGRAGQDLMVTQANGRTGFLRELNVKDDLWILLNIPANYSLDLLNRLGIVLGNHDLALNAALAFGPQAVGMGLLPGGLPNLLVPTTAHHSWPKAGALLGLGGKQVQRIDVDEFGRLEVERLEINLREMAEKKIPVVLVVVNIGSASLGAIDPIKEVADLRERLRVELNFDFNIHADASWGGYACTTLNPSNEPVPRASNVPQSSYVRKQLGNIHRADTASLDPHKAGYIQHPSGSICFQNERMRDMLAYKDSYDDDCEDSSDGRYSIDAARPGAAVVATYLHHRVTGLTPQGHGLLVGQANFTAKLLCALLAAMAGPDDPFVISQIHPPPPESLSQLRRWLSMPNEKLISDPNLMALLRENGPDFLINLFAVNFSYPIFVFDGEVRTQNTNLQQAIRLMEIIGEQLCAGARPKGIRKKCLSLDRDTLKTKAYEKTITKLTKAINLQYHPMMDPEVSLLSSTITEPWPNPRRFLDTCNSDLRQSILRGIGQLNDEPETHAFVIVESFNAEMFGEHVSSVRASSQSYQTIVKFEFGLADSKTGVVKNNENVKHDMLHEYREYLYQIQAYEPLVLVTRVKETMHSFLYKDEDKQWIEVDIYVGLSQEYLLGFYLVRVSDVLLNNHFDPAATYSLREVYFVFGSGDKVYASHIITKFPNYHHMVHLQNPPPGISDSQRELGVEVTLVGVSKVADRTASRLEVGHTHDTEIKRENGDIVKSTLTVKRNVWFDTSCNEKPVPKLHTHVHHKTCHHFLRILHI
eukprot:Phypoly_transcript_01913.p1 GENE.Phypoly_transcript_01913~~Phypoly_transcript_01913.p1  ORF type:complete len:981 (+),score=109.53 Phypoly_transcript_01913:79-2943(+)